MIRTAQRRDADGFAPQLGYVSDFASLRDSCDKGLCSELKHEDKRFQVLPPSDSWQELFIGQRGDVCTSSQQRLHGFRSSREVLDRRAQAFVAVVPSSPCQIDRKIADGRFGEGDSHTMGISSSRCSCTASCGQEDGQDQDSSEVGHGSVRHSITLNGTASC